MMNERQTIIDICRRLEARALVSGRDGNISLRADNKSMYVTASGINKGMLTNEAVLLQAFDGTVLEGTMRSTREAALHSRIYMEREDVNAIIHTHPPYATAFACMGKTLPTNVLAEVSAIIGKMAVAPYAPPGSQALVDSLKGLISDCNVIFLMNHGIMVMGPDMQTAYDTMDALENAAKTIIMAKLYGDIVPIP